MKRFQISLAMLAITTLSIISSCKKDNTPGATCGSGLLCATVDGVGYTASPYNTATTGGFFGGTTYNGSFAQLIPSNTSTGGYYLTVTGNNGTAGTGATWQIDFTITQLPVNGQTYSTTAGSASFDYYAGSTSNQLHYVSDSAHTGTVTITSIDTVNNYITGTFAYTATEAPGKNYTPTQHVISSGSFTKIIVRR